MKITSQFLHLATKLPQQITISILSTITSLLLTALSHLPIFKSPPSSSSSSSANYILILDPSSPSLPPVPISVVTASIKATLPVVPYSDSAHRNVGIDNLDNPLCAVCLDCVEDDHVIRELVNCKHVFHGECLDRWLDVGKASAVNCPLCRSILLPPKKLLSSVSSVSSAAAETFELRLGY